MTDCGCEKARRDLEEYLRHEVCKTQQSDIAEHLAHCAECSDEALVVTHPDGCHRAGVQGDRARGAARPGADDAPGRTGHALTAPLVSCAAMRALRREDRERLRYHVDRQRQRADRIAVRIGGDPGRRQPHRAREPHRHLSHAGVGALVDPRQQPQQPQAPRGAHEDHVEQPVAGVGIRADRDAAAVRAAVADRRHHEVAGHASPACRPRVASSTSYGMPARVRNSTRIAML